MTRSENREQRSKARAWTVALAAIAAWVLLATNSADAQQIQVPDVVLAQVLGPAAAASAAPTPRPAAEKGTALVAHRMHQQFQEQLVAGVSRPSVELEVHFDFDSDVIHDESRPQIEAAAAVMTDHFPDTRFRVAGYTDVAGSAEYNQVLSERRAQAVWQQLVDEYGVSADRLERVGFGEDLSEEASNAQRRRVELQIVRGENRPL